jgi:hypothetical protein
MFRRKKRRCHYCPSTYIPLTRGFTDIMLDDLMSFFISIHDRFSVVDCDGLGNASPIAAPCIFVSEVTHLLQSITKCTNNRACSL